MKKLFLIASILAVSIGLLSFTVKHAAYSNEVVYMGGRNINGQNTVNSNPVNALQNTAAYHDVQGKMIITAGTGITSVPNSDSTAWVVTNTGMATKVPVAFSGTTNASGNVTLTFSPAFAVAPNIQANIIGGTNTNLIKIGIPTTTGVTVNVVNRTDVVGLLPSYANVAGASVDIIVTAK